MAIRKAEKAGAWYPADPDELRMWLTSFLDACPANAADVAPPSQASAIEETHTASSQATMPAGASDKGGMPRAALVPHAGLAFSGLTAAHAYKAFMSYPVTTVILLGAVHTMSLDVPALWADGSWETPLGDLKVDVACARRILNTTHAQSNRKPHLGDNALELQMPFIKHCFPDASIVPIAVPPQEGIEQFGMELADEANQSGTIFIASSDMTHYGSAFGLMPAGTGPDAVAWVYANDHALLDCMLAGDSASIIPEAETHHSACGAGAIAALLGVASACGWRGRLLHYCTSHDIHPEPVASHMVGYASVLFSA